uniref:Uncharacterized protein n=1 Tax=Solanum lycopersicum TaxID=4081 RepID=K4CF77_SOLLC
MINAIANCARPVTFGDYLKYHIISIHFSSLVEYVIITALGIVGALTKFDDPYGSHALHFFLESEYVMDLCDEMSRKHDHEVSWMLQVLHLNIYGCLYFPPIEDRKRIAKKAALSSKRKK